MSDLRKPKYCVNDAIKIKEAIKILGVSFPNDKTLQLENNITLTLEGKIIIFKTLALSKVTSVAQVLVFP